MKIKLNKGKFAIIDDEDFEFLSQWKWSCDSRGYAVRHEQKAEYGSNPRRMRKMHREILLHHGFDIEEKFIDHKNNQEYDNRKENLRVASNGQNQANAKEWKTNTSGYRGVVKMNKNKPFNINKPWGAQIVINGKRIFKGMFENKEQAALVYNELAKRYFGEYAKLNVIGGNL